MTQFKLIFTIIPVLFFGGRIMDADAMPRRGSDSGGAVSGLPPPGIIPLMRVPQPVGVVPLTGAPTLVGVQPPPGRVFV
jgi:hypothetical protein